MRPAHHRRSGSHVTKDGGIAHLLLVERRRASAENSLPFARTIRRVLQLHASGRTGAGRPSPGLDVSVETGRRSHRARAPPGGRGPLHDGHREAVTALPLPEELPSRPRRAPRRLSGGLGRNGADDDLVPTSRRAATSDALSRPAPRRDAHRKSVDGLDDDHRRRDARVRRPCRPATSDGARPRVARDAAERGHLGVRRRARTRRGRRLVGQGGTRRRSRLAMAHRRSWPRRRWRRCERTLDELLVRPAQRIADARPCP